MQELLDDDMDESDLEGAGGGGSRWSEDIRNAAKNRRKETAAVAKMGKVRQAVFDKKA